MMSSHRRHHHFQRYEEDGPNVIQMMTKIFCTMDPTTRTPPHFLWQYQERRQQDH